MSTNNPTGDSFLEFFFFLNFSRKYQTEDNLTNLIHAYWTLKLMKHSGKHVPVYFLTDWM